ncbi:plasmid mobilization protein [Oribacterium sp. WCC10]|uniref:plasmid mobilization protein n=1 Tax=Oribacterium sp. WCC10 TaxID=1855343 RepID=UPI0008F20CB4|nr:plasmid mobilization relaxosome protein MobC [Oribacterium sp. WCC10]SFG75720.1 mobilisation protein (MobC) [Oribacterium sp. WCC10]
MEKRKRLEARLTEQELKLIEEKMKKCGIRNKSAFLRKMAIDGCLIQLDLSDVKEMIRLLRINSNNLNQYARKANECGSVYEKDIRELQNQQKLIWVEMRKILENLSKLQK